MKTGLIPVDPLDDLAALQDKIAWAKAPRALLLWPDKGCEVQRPLDFVRLRRAADRLGVQVAVVTRNRKVRREASAAGLPVFADRKAALRRAWRWRRVRLPRRRHLPDLAKLRAWARRPLPWHDLKPWQRWSAFAAGVSAVLMLLALLLPGAEMTLTLASQPRHLTLTARLDPQAPTVHGETLPVHWETATVGTTATRAAHGRADLPLRPAEARLQLTNLTAERLRVPAGTRVHSHDDAFTFVTTAAVVLPPGPGASAEVAARALQRGRTTNLAAHALGFLEAPFTFSVAADNPQPARGGKNLRVPAPSPTDYERLEAEVRANLAAQALAEVQARFPDAWLVLPSLQVDEDLERTFDPPAPHTPANILRLTLRTRYRILVIRRQDALALAQAALMAQAPQGQALVPHSVRIVADAAGPQGTAPPYRWTFHIQGEFAAPPPSAAKVQQMAAGRSRAAAQARLQAALPLSAPPEIRTMPSWWPWLPWLPLRIRVQVHPWQP